MGSMTLKEVIKRLEALKLPIKTGNDYENHRAVHIGIEAVKTVRAERTLRGFKYMARLPGETEE